ncbi:hypothetical protein AB7X06_22655, partial [Providencia rettgeri]
SAREGTSEEQAFSLRYPFLIPTASRLLVGENQFSQKTSFCPSRFLRFLSLNLPKIGRLSTGLGFILFLVLYSFFILGFLYC